MRSVPYALLSSVLLVHLVGCSSGDGAGETGDVGRETDPRESAETPPGTEQGDGETSTDVRDIDPPATSQIRAALVSLRNCEEVDQAVRAAAARAMNDLLDTRLEEALGVLEEGGCYYYSYRGVDEVMWAVGTGGSAAVPAANDGSGTTSAAESPTDVSETNNQVAGVDEADFVKNDEDGNIYLIADGALQIVDGWPADQARLLSRTALEDEPKRLFLDGDRLLLFSSVPKTAEQTADYQSWYYQNSSECTYGYDCDFTGDGNGTRLSVFDIADRTAPRLLRTIDTSATFISARKVGSAVHTVLYEEPELLRKLPVVPEEIETNGLCADTETRTPGPGDADRVEALFDQLREDNLALIEEAPVEQLLGVTQDQLLDGTTRERDLQTCSGFYDSPLADGTAFLTLMSLDLQSDESAQTSTIISRPGASYASADAYYVSVRQQPVYGYWYYDSGEVEEASTVHKFALAGPSNQYAASGLVKGRVLNQFSIDEYQGDLRIATTTGHLPSPDVHSTLSVLKQSGTALELVGQADEIAPAEDIRAVRFLGDKGYVVTFKKTDPLFVFDLSDPTNPQALGELKIPGYSTYLHPLGADHLLSIGYDSDDQVNFAWFTGLLLQIFDVSDPSDPQLLHREVIGARGSSSEAATNHLAFNYFAPREVLAIPATVCEDSAGGGSYAETMTFSGLLVYDVSTTDGFTLRGQVDHPYVDPVDSSTYYVGGACSNWWTDSNSVVQRTIFMDDFVYSVSDLLIKVNSLTDLSTDVAEVSLQEATGAGG
jgi:uncharacterized secreted protein with C-terminal beta-propeller domain